MFPSLSCDCRSRSAFQKVFFFWGWLVTKLKRETCLVSQFKRRDYTLNMCVEGEGSWGEVSIKSGHDEDVGDWIGLVIKK